jgi:methionyl-tRNA synthetase
MIERYFDGVVPSIAFTAGLTALEAMLASSLAQLDIATSFRNKAHDFSSATTAVWQTIAIIDSLITTRAPWKLAKSSEDKDALALSETLYTAAESIRIITALLYPILPYATASVWRQLGLGDIEQAAKDGELRNLQWGGLKPGTRLGPLSPIFPRADKKLIEIMTQMEQDKNTPIAHANAQHDATAEPKSEFPEAPIASQESVKSVESVSSLSPGAPPRTTTLAEPNPGAQVAASTAVTTERDPTPLTTDHVPLTTSTISIDDFIKIELRVAKILVAERIPKADKLLRLEVDLGYETRQILSGIAEHYTPEQLIGRRIVVITNLAPRKMRGLESHGMLLAASDGDHGKPVLATFPDSDEIPLGSRLK